MSHREMLRGFVVAATLLAGAAPASAADPLVIGPGRDASVAIDFAGTAHVVYNANGTADQTLNYCRLPPGQSTCGAAQALDLAGSTTIRPHVFVDGQTVRILTYRYGLSPGPFAQDLLLTSTDGGKSFAPPVSVGTLEASDAVAGPGAAISIVSSATATAPSYQRVPTDGSAPATTAARLSSGYPQDSTVGLLAGATPVAASTDGGSAPRISYSRYQGGDPNADASWSSDFLTTASAPQLAGGPTGLFMLATFGNATDARLEVFKADEAGRFPRGGAGVSDSQAGGFAASALVQDDGGVLQAIYSGGEGNTQLFENAAPGTTIFGTPSKLVKDTSFLRLEAAAGRDHAGVAVWHTGTGDGAAVHAARFATNVRAETPGVFDLRAKGLEVTQGVQTQEAGFVGGELPSLYPVPPPGQLPTRQFGNVRYRGVALAAASKTVVRFFADATPQGTDRTASAGGVIGLLRGFRGGKELPGSPLLAETGARTLTDGKCVCVTAAERADPRASYDFTLPLEWTESGGQRLTLRGEVRQPAGILSSFANARPVKASATSARECTGCEGNNKLTLTDIPFTPTPNVVIAPVRMMIKGQADLRDPAKVFEQALNLHPGGERLLVEPYQGTIDVTKEAGWTTTSPECKAYVDENKFGDCKNDAYIGRLAAWDRARGDLSDMTIGVNTQERGVADRSLFNVPYGNPDLTATPNEVSARPVAIVNDNRPLTSVAHELGHLMGRIHASKACGGNGNDWPPDQVGYVDGIGLNRLKAPGTAGRVIAGAPRTPGNCATDSPPDCGGASPTNFFDVMSYCAGEANAWIAARTWQTELGTLNRFGQRVGFGLRLFAAVQVRDSAPTGSRLAQASAAPARLHVEATVNGAGAFITDVGPAVNAAPAPDSSPYEAVVTDAEGTALSATPMAASSGHVEGGGQLVALAADVPFAAAARAVSVRSSGTVIATRKRSAHAPTVRVTSPKRGASIRAKGTVRWAAKDADGDALAATVAYSRDNGKTWRTVYAGPDTGRAALPGAYFSASRRARVLVRVNDGFNESGAQSQTFRARGAKPQVRILPASSSKPMLNTSTLVLSGQAFDDQAQPLIRRRLTWYAGKRRIGRGTALSTSDLAPGRQRIRLVAKDRTGRSASASTTVKVVATQPQILALSAPKRVSRKARSVTLAIAVSVRAKLKVNGRSTPVGRQVRKVKVPIKSGRGALRLRLVLSAGGRSATVPIALPRK
jgi:hypothetical protein